MQVDELRSKIRRAFDKVSYPANVRDMLAAPYSSNDDAYEMAAAFHDKAWASVEIVELFRHREMLFALSPTAFAAYLPAYLVATLATEDPLDKYGADLRWYLMESLAAVEGSSEARKDTTAARLAALTQPQRAVAIEVVKYLEQRWNMPNAQGPLDALGASA